MKSSNTREKVINVLDTTIQLPAELSLAKIVERHVMGSSNTRYVARLHIGSLGPDKHIPEGIVSHNLQRDIEVEIPQEIYEYLLEQHGDVSAYGRVSLELYVPKEDL